MEKRGLWLKLAIVKVFLKKFAFLAQAKGERAVLSKIDIPFPLVIIVTRAKIGKKRT
jgi:hypothetical protein